MTDKWSPIRDIWNDYDATLRTAKDEGKLDGELEEAHRIIYPQDLWIGSEEKDDIHEFVHDRMSEIVTESKTKGVDPNMLGSYIFRALLAGMLWERERMGK
jgi:hypothetical protein